MVIDGRKRVKRQADCERLTHSAVAETCSTSKVGGRKKLIMIANTIILMTEKIASYVVELVTSILGSYADFPINLVKILGFAAIAYLKCHELYLPLFRDSCIPQQCIGHTIDVSGTHLSNHKTRRLSPAQQ
jgi:hypothetical protein